MRVGRGGFGFEFEFEEEEEVMGRGAIRRAEVRKSRGRVSLNSWGYTLSMLAY